MHYLLRSNRHKQLLPNSLARSRIRYSMRCCESVRELLLSLSLSSSCKPLLPSKTAHTTYLYLWHLIPSFVYFLN